MTLLEVMGLVHHFDTPGGKLQAIRGVDFTLARSQTVALVGESGSGKSTTARAVARLTEPTQGQVLLEGVDIFRADRSQLRGIRRDIQMVFQDPYSSLDPRRTVRQSIQEPLDVHRIGSRKERVLRVRELLELVGLDHGAMESLPSNMSGGQRQRVAIARALALDPKLVVCDEAVSALDVSVQAQVLNLLRDLQDRLGISYLFITHDLAVVSEIADMVAVMYLGRIIEWGTRAQVLGDPQHPYTQALLSAAPSMGTEAQRTVLVGDAPSALSPPAGCSFRLRCQRAQTLCAEIDPHLSAGNGAGQRVGQTVACHFPGQNPMENA